MLASICAEANYWIAIQFYENTPKMMAFVLIRAQMFLLTTCDTACNAFQIFCVTEVDL